jgi:hypothetical protein
VSPATVIAAAGALGAVTAIVLARTWRREVPPGGRHAARRQGSYPVALRSVTSRLSVRRKQLVT